MKTGIKHTYHITMIQLTVLFVLTVAQGYLSLMGSVALSCRCPDCGLWEALLFDSLVAIIIVTPILSFVERIIHLATTRLYIHAIFVLAMWLIIDGRLLWERSCANQVTEVLSMDYLLPFALPIAVGLAIYLPIYRWSRKHKVLLGKH